ncbi:MAG: beta-galactosidase [Anaerolineae bacterium]|nr:beta-galactosidase [Anaerolineae bacterium]
MNRRFRTHDLRQVMVLDGVWDFAFLGDVDPDTVDVGAITFEDRMAVPGCFDATPVYAGQRGLVAYRTRLSLLDAAPYRLVFDSVHHWCRVFVDGGPLRDHVGGFTQFAVDLPDHPVGEVALVVLVDNRFDYERCPLHLEYFDWYHFGGITRSVTLHRLGDIWIDGVQIVTRDYQTRAVAITIDYGAVVARGGMPLTLTCDGEKVLATTVDIFADHGQVTYTLHLSEAALWSPDAPHLHMLHVKLGDDDMRERFGIRQVRVEGQSIAINGGPVQLLGVNRHEAHPQFGHALPDSLLVSDVQQLRDLGCNFVRGSHYPQDARFLDLCDEAVLCVWSESIGWQQTAEHLTDPHYLAAQESNIAEMVRGARNHPSVILWGIQNESHSNDPECRPAYARFLGQLRSLDDSRPLTFASNHPFDDVCLDLADVISINCYPGWYGGEIEDIPAELDRIIARLDEVGQGDKPLIISEIGGGAIYGWRDWNATRWSEQYQARLLEVVIRHLFIDGARACGLAIWQYCDIRSSQEARRTLFRPRAFNNKGLVDEYRRPKLAYDVVKRLYHQLQL